MYNDDFNDSNKNMNQKDNNDDLRQAVITKQFNDKKKKNPFSNWDKIRGNVGNHGALKGSPTSSSSVSPSSSRSSTANSFSQYSRKSQTNPFMRSFAGDQTNNNGADIKAGRYNMSMADTTLVAAQAAGMTNFARNFRGVKHRNGVIYATSTAVQQDIYKLERELEKIISQLTLRSQHASFAESASTLMSTSANHESGMLLTHPLMPTSTKRSVFRRSSIVDILHTTTNFVSDLTPLKENVSTGITKASHTMILIMEALKKHKSATRLPLRREILAILAVAFDRKPMLDSECDQALDVFDYIRHRFTQLDAAELLEQLLFSCRLMNAGDLNTKLRVLDIIESQIQLLDETTVRLPSTPSAYQSLVYTITEALAQLTYTQMSSNDELKEQVDIESSCEKIRRGLLNILVKLADGTLIPPAGDNWAAYHTAPEAPVSVAQFCVVESLLKSAMVGVCCQNDPYQGEEKQPEANKMERPKDIIIFQELLQHFWIEPQKETHVAYVRILFLLSELACETFLGATLEDIEAKNSTASLLLLLVVEKLSPERLQKYLPDLDTDEAQRAAALSVINVLLALLTIWNLNDIMQQERVDAMSSPIGAGFPTLNNHNGRPDAQPLKPITLFDNSDFDANYSDSISQHEASRIVKQFIKVYWNAGYADLILQGTESMLQDATSERSACAYYNLIFNIDQNMGQEITKKTLPALFKRLLDTHPPAIQPLCSLLFKISRQFPTVFYKPVITCAASDDSSKVTRLMKLILRLRNYLSGVQFWMHDAEMVNVLLLSEVGRQKQQRQSAANMNTSSTSQPNTPQTKPNVDQTQTTRWGSTTLGQCIIATEFMWTIKELRYKQADANRNMEEDEIAKKFLIDLEKRLAVFLTAKEKKVLVPMPLRNILCNIFIDIRFFCNTTHRPGWLSRVIDWVIQPVISQPGVSTYTPSQSEIQQDCEEDAAILNLARLDSISAMYQKIQNIHSALTEELQLDGDNPSNLNTRIGHSTLGESDTQSIEVPRHKRQQYIYAMYPMSRAVMNAITLKPPGSIRSNRSNVSESDSNSDDTAYKLTKYRLEHVSEINQHPFGSVCSLLCAVYTTLSSQEFSRLVKPLWERFLDDRDPKALVPAAFLLMQCGEKIPKLIIETATQDFYSEDPLKRLSAIQRHAALSSFRFNVLGQEYIPISNRRRPFRGDGGAFTTPFVPTDLGSNRFALDEPRWMAKLKNASNFPIELKRQIQELGWDDEDNGEEQEALKKVLTPLVLLPSLFLEEEEERMNEDEHPELVRRNGKTVDISKIINRRKRASTVQTLTVSFLSMVDLLNDDNGGSLNSLHELLEYFLRDDPSHFLRTFLNNLGKLKLERHKDILTRIRFLVSMQNKLPPGLTHILFNYLAGMLKWLVRETKSKDGLTLMTLIHPILAELILSTNDLSIRDLRKNKIEHLLISTGRFWFRHEQPAEMFPRFLSDGRTPFSILDIPTEVFSVAMLRISHIQFLTNYLVRYPREVYAVKKTLQDYEPLPIPGIKSSTSWTTPESFFPNLMQRKNNNITYSRSSQPNTYDKNPTNRQPLQQTLDGEMLSAVRARVWLRFIDVLLTGLNKNYNDREELERILKGINTIMADHIYDFNIVGQALILYTRVVTRFKRLFISNRGYSTFLPALFRVFCEVDCYPQIRSGIIFAWCRFYAVHGEAFVFQMLGTLVPIILTAYHKSEELGSWMSDNLFILMQAMHSPPHLGSTSDVLGLQLQVELDDHDRSVQERIDAASNPMAMPLTTGILKPLAKSMTMPLAVNHIANFGNFAFDLQNFIKLFLTIIAYDPGSLRAEQFVKIFRHMMPRFQEFPNLRGLLDEGIAALVDVFNKFGKHAKVTLNNASTAPQQPSSGGYQGVPPEMDNVHTEAAQHAYGKQWQQNDRLTIRLEFVRLVQEYLGLDGTLNEICHEKMASIVRNIMRDYGNFKNLALKTDWIKSYLIHTVQSMAALRSHTKPLKKLLSQIYVQYRAQYKNMVASDLYEGMAIMLELGQEKLMNMHEVAAIINEKFVIFGLNLAAGINVEKADKEEHSKFCNALVRLILAIMERTSVDVLDTIEQQPATPNLMIRILIPICLKHDKPETRKSQLAPAGGNHDPLSTWMRLLNYITRACNQASLLKLKPTGFSLSHFAATMGHTATQNDATLNEFSDIRDSKQTPLSIALLFSLSFIALKIILVRGGSDIDRLKGAWARIAYFIKSALVFGQTLKFLKPKSGRSSPNLPTTPLSGALSPGIPTFAGGASPLNYTAVSPSTESRGAFSVNASLGVNTIYDYTTWRFMEFILYYRCPLIMYLKGFICEKTMELGSMTNNYTLYTPNPSPRISMNLSTSNNLQRESSGTGKRREGTSEGSSSISNRSSFQSSPFGIIPQLNIQDIDAEESEPNGLGLKNTHEQYSNVNYHQQSPGLHPAMPPSLTANNDASLLHSNGSSVDKTSTERISSSSHINVPHSPIFNKPSFETTSSSRTSVPGHKPLNVQNADGALPATILHVLYAESVTSIVQIQLSFGIKPTLPWMANKKQCMKPWTRREAMSQLSNEWRLLLQLYEETLNASATTKLHTNANASTTNINTTAISNNDSFTRIIGKFKKF